jgi:hypothetical protein
LRAATSETNDRIVATAKNVSVVNEKCIGDVVEAADSLVVVDGDGLFAEVGAGHDESLEFAAGEEEMVERGVGEKSAEEAIPGSDAAGETGVRFAWKQNDGSFHGKEQFFCGVVNLAKAIDIFDTTKHYGEGLFNAALSFAKRMDSGLRTGVASEVEAADTLDGKDAILL